MTPITPERLGDMSQEVADLEGELQAVVRKNVSFLRKPPDGGSEGADSVSTLIQRIAGVSLEEIDRVIGQLEAMRETLLNEGKRVQREIAGYAAVNEAALASVRAIEENLNRWRTAG